MAQRNAPATVTPPLRTIFLNHLQRQFRVASMRADLAHQEHFLPLALEALAHPHFGFAPVVFPTVVEKINAAIEGLIDDQPGRMQIFRVAEMMAPQP